jgi:hypothetical protein
VRTHNQVSFELGNYDRSRELVIDPAVSYATYLGGLAEDDGHAIAADGSGNAWITGQTKSINFPTKNPLASHSSNAGGFDVFVTELSSTGALVYSTYIGGTSDDSGNAIALDASGNVFVAGGTKSLDFPTKGPFQSALAGATNAFVLELSSTGSTLMYSTFLGGNGSDVASGLAVDSAGNAYVAGTTSSTTFPQKNPIASESAGGFVTALNSTGNGLIYSTYLGAGLQDFASAVAVDSAGNAYVTGATKTPTFKTTTGAFQSTCGTDTNCNGGLYDAFVCKIPPTGGSLAYSTFLGGESNEQGLGIAIDSAGDAYVTGVTTSTQFPLTSNLQPAYAGNGDAFVTELNPTGTAPLVYSTYLGGIGGDSGLAIAVDGNKNAYVTGVTGSSDFPAIGPTQLKIGGQNDAFVTEIGAGGSSYIFSTYLGGSLNENTATTGGGSLAGIAVDGSGSIYVTGNTVSTDFPAVSALQGTAGGAGLADAFVAKFSASGAPANFTVAAGALSPASGHAGVSATSTITVTSLNGFAGTVALGCTVVPAVSKAPTCSGTSVNVAANGTATGTLTVNTTAASALLERPASQRSSGIFYAMLMPVGGMALLGAGIGSAGSHRKKLFGFLMLGLLLFGLLLMPACGGSSSTTTHNPGTPNGPYTITVTGTSGQSVVNGTPTLTLTVN